MLQKVSFRQMQKEFADRKRLNLLRRVILENSNRLTKEKCAIWIPCFLKGNSVSRENQMHTGNSRKRPSFLIHHKKEFMT